MARIFLSYIRRDSDIVSAVVSGLREHGHEASVDVAAQAAGQEWRLLLEDSLRAADVFVVFLSQNSITSPYILSEIGAARAYAQTGSRMLFIPIVLDGIAIPEIVADIQAIVSPSRDAQEIVTQIDRAIASHLGRQVAVKEKAQEVTATEGACLFRQIVRLFRGRVHEIPVP